MSETVAGGVVYRREGAQLRFLVVTAKKHPSHWIFPKGHIEEGETAADAARREVAEEAGVVGRVVAPLGVSTFETESGTTHVEFFLLEYVRDVPPDDNRQVCWLGYKQALATLTFAGAREKLRAAWDTLR